MVKWHDDPARRLKLIWTPLSVDLEVDRETPVMSFYKLYNLTNNQGGAI